MSKSEYYLTQARYDAYLKEIEYMEGDGQRLLAILLASSPGSGMGRPNDLPAHQTAGEFKGHLQDIKNIVKLAVIIDDIRDKHLDLDEVVIGCMVKVRYEGEEELEEYTILGRHEVNITEGKISCWSPVGAALIGKREGDIVTVNQSSSRVTHMKIEQVSRFSLDFDYSTIDWKDRLEQEVAPILKNNQL